MEKPYYIIYRSNVLDNWEIIEEHDNKKDALESLAGHREAYKYMLCQTRICCYPSKKTLAYWNA